MKGSKKSYPQIIGETVKAERAKRKMSQKSFYEFLFPGSYWDDKGVKSKMHDIEHGKTKFIDPAFLQALHDKCNLGMDYIFGFETEFPNHENEQASAYTGLNSKTVEILHELEAAKDASIPEFEPGMSDEEYKHICEMRSDKQEAEWILKILEVLLSEDIDKGETYPNYNILFDLYMVSVVKPAKLRGVPVDSLKGEYGLREISEQTKELNMDFLNMTDSFGGLHTINVDKIHQQIWKDKLYLDVERFITTAQMYFARSCSSDL